MHKRAPAFAPKKQKQATATLNIMNRNQSNMQTELLTQILDQTTRNRIQQTDWTSGIKDSGFQSLLDMFSQVFENMPQAQNGYSSQEQYNIDDNNGFEQQAAYETTQDQIDDQQPLYDPDAAQSAYDTQSQCEQSSQQQTAQQANQQETQPAQQEVNDQDQVAETAATEKSQTQAAEETAAEPTEQAEQTEQTEQGTAQESAQAEQTEQPEESEQTQEQSTDEAIEQALGTIIPLVTQLKEILAQASQNATQGKDALSPEMKEQLKEIISALSEEFAGMAKTIKESPDQGQAITKIVSELMTAVNAEKTSTDTQAAQQPAALAQQAAKTAQATDQANIKTDADTKQEPQVQQQTNEQATGKETVQTQQQAQTDKNTSGLEAAKPEIAENSSKKVIADTKTQDAKNTTPAPQATDAQQAKESKPADNVSEFLKNLLENMTEKTANAKAQAKTQQTIASFENPQQSKAQPEVQAQALTVAQHIVDKLVEAAAGKTTKTAGTELFTALEQELSKIKQALETSAFDGKEASMQSDAKGTATTQTNMLAADASNVKTENTNNFAQTLAGMRSSNGQQVTEQGLMRQITNSMKFTVTDGKMQAKIQLDPPDLGRVMVQINIDGDRLVANMQVESEAAKQIMEKNLDQLRESLAQQGFDVDQCHVNLSEDHSQTGNSNRRPMSGTRTFFKSGQNTGDEEQEQTVQAGPQQHSDHNGQIDYLA